MTEREFPASLGAPGQARQFVTVAVRTLLGDRVERQLLDDLQLVVSELVTNAVRAGSPTVHVELDRVGSDRIVVRVSDVADGWPHPRAAADDDPSGRGLALVSAVAASWGARLDEDTKTVWAELSVGA